MKILLTGVAGFIGFHVAERLRTLGHQVVGLDNLNEYYDPTLKHARLARLQAAGSFEFQKIDIANRPEMDGFFRGRKFDAFIHLAAQAGVRYSIESPSSYIDSNLVGFANVLEICRGIDIPHLVYASSSSVYGGNKKLPFSEGDRTDTPLNLYAATKKSNELMAHAYSHLFQLPTTGLRFFTVYGPFGRPDMALFKFTASILRGEAIPVFNQGHMIRDFTFVDDVVEGTLRLLHLPPTSNGGEAPHRVVNIGNSHAVELMHCVQVLEKSLGKKALLSLLPMQPGDVPATLSDTSELERLTGFRPRTTVDVGVPRFVEWYRSYYKT